LLIQKMDNYHPNPLAPAETAQHPIRAPMPRNPTVVALIGDFGRDVTSSDRRESTRSALRRKGTLWAPGRRLSTKTRPGRHPQAEALRCGLELNCIKKMLQDTTTSRGLTVARTTAAYQDAGVTPTQHSNDLTCKGHEALWDFEVPRPRDFTQPTSPWPTP